MIIARNTTSENMLDQVNGRYYRRANLVRNYATAKLFPAEAAALVRYRDDILDRRVLDLGCGAGRLAVYLRPLVARYVGIDVSPHMVSYCRKNFPPDLEFCEADMRSLTPIGDRSFDAVFAVSNLIDAVGHADRLRVLAEVRRVLIEGGLFLFSSHNRHYVRAGSGPTLEFHRNPLTQVRLFADFLQARLNHYRYRALQQFGPEYALINDSGNNFRNLHYYVARDVQARQLDDSGFKLCACLDSQGMSLEPGADDAACPSIVYVARRRD
jgi:SAM-dependent methyltransferase